MPETTNNINNNRRINLSRNRPTAFVVGGAGFLGSHIIDGLFEKNVQIVVIDDLSTGDKKNINLATRNKDFHFLNDKIENIHSIDLPRLDYAFFMVSEESDSTIFTKGLTNFLKIIKDNNPDNSQLDSDKSLPPRPTTKVVLTSNIKLYNKDLGRDLKKLKDAETIFARFSKENNLNARIIRLGPIFGPRMHFREDDPIVRLIQATLLGELQKEQTSLDFTTRALFVEDAARLVIKTIFSGSTAHKIYDGILPQPIKVSEIKQILLDPLWHESRGFKATELPPWFTPNAQKTIRELNFHPRVGIIEALKETVAYFEKNGLPEFNEEKYRVDPAEKRLIENQQKPEEIRKEDRGEKKDQKRIGEYLYYLKNHLPIFLILIIISYGLLLPVVSVIVGSLNIKNNLQASQQAISKGNFGEAVDRINEARSTTVQIQEALSFLKILGKFNLTKDYIDDVDQMLQITSEGIEASLHAAVGMEALFKTTKIISGEDMNDPKPLYQKAQVELGLASEKINKARVLFPDNKILGSPPKFAENRVNDFKLKLDLYADLIEKAKTASFLIPEITALDGKKSYLILLQNNLELRPAGGFIGSYARIDFEEGKIKSIKVDDIYNLDGALKEIIEPPPEIKSDLGQSRFFLRDSNFEPDFPTSARQASFFYRKEAGENVQGVIALDLSGSSKLIDAVGGLDLPDYGERITGDNLFEKSVSYAEVDFFPGSQKKRNFLISLQSQLFNKLFFSTGQNWPGIALALGESLQEKHMMIYLADPELFSYVVSQNWAGILPRQKESVEGETNDFLAVVDANLGANKSNYYLERSYKLETTLDKEGEINHHLTVNYKNNSPSDVFPGGRYKNRLRIYLPAGANMKKVIFGEESIIDKLTTFSDYGRNGYSLLIEVLPKETKILSFEYQLEDTLSFQDSKAIYNLDVFKQAGTDRDSFEWVMSYPINFQVKSEDKSFQEIKRTTNLLTDKTFSIIFTK